MKTKILSLFLFLTLGLTAQTFVPVKTNASEAEILQAALIVRPSVRQMNWQEMEYYGFIHFGINTFTGEEWSDGTNSPTLFNPTELNADQWVKAFKDAGMKGMILTAKHHDGFCLWPTKTTDYSIKNSPWRNGKGDLVREVADACQRQGLQLGIYLSPWDRNHPTYGNSPVYNQVFRDQLNELLTNYGDVFEVWFDGANGEGPNGKVQEYEFESFYSLIRELQPHAVIAIMGPDVRWVGNEAGRGRDPEWSALPAGIASRKTISENSQSNVNENMFVPKDARGADLGSRNLLKGTQAMIWYPSEVDTSIRPGWFYHANQDKQVKSLEKLEEIYYASIGMNSSLLLNIPPDRRGLIHENDVQRLNELRRLIDKTFENNLLNKAKITAKSESQKTKVASIADNNKLSYWRAKSGVKEPIIEINFSKVQMCDRLLLQENIRNGQRIESFVFEVFKDGKWITLAEGKTVGYKRILRFPAVEIQKARIRFTAFRAQPEIIEAGLFMKP